MKWLRLRKRVQELEFENKYQFERGYTRGFAEGIKEPDGIDNTGAKKERWIFSERDGLFYCSKCNGGMVNNIYPYCPWCGENLRRE